MERKNPTLLMKELKYYQEELKRLHREDINKSQVPLDDKMNPKYETGYSYKDNRQRIDEIHEKESRIRSALAKFNAYTHVEGMDYTIAEALVVISQLKDEIKVLQELAERPEIYTETGYRGESTTYKINYQQGVVMDDLKRLHQQLTDIQMAVDRTNLTAEVEY